MRPWFPWPAVAGLGASPWHLAVAGRLPDPLAVVTLDAVVAYAFIVTYWQADVKQECAGSTWGSDRSLVGHVSDSIDVRVTRTGNDSSGSSGRGWPRAGPSRCRGRTAPWQS